MESIMKFVNRTARCVALLREKKIQPYGLGAQHHYYILNICRCPGISQDELAELVFVNKSNVARQLALLEQNGFVTRTPLPSDRRQMQLFPTEKALELLPAIHTVLGELNTRLLEDFTIDEQRQLCAMMEKVMKKAVELTTECSAPKKD